MLFVFVVDASGSMAANRMAQAKGALMRLLEKAYLHRDQVALISFQRSNARVLLEPTRSVARARRAIEAMPAGGATPLAAGLMRGLETVRLARLHGAGNAMLVLLTDGRANMPLSKPVDDAVDPRSVILDELREVGLALGKESVPSIIVDTKSSFLTSGEARSLADAIGAEYLYLPRADGAAVYDSVRWVAAQMRR
jgi:magnesium chelatase subunit D